MSTHTENGVVLTDADALVSLSHEELLSLYIKTREELVQTRYALAKAKESLFLDPLTALYNRRGALDAFTRTLSRAERADGIPPYVGVALLDIDHFKAVNDTYGHDVGDKVLCRLAETMQSIARQSETPFRWGGEEMGVLLEVAAHEPWDRHEGLLRFGLRLGHAVATMTPVLDPCGRPVSITVSVGLTAVAINDATSLDSLIAKADPLMYASKRHGRNRVTVDIGDPDAPLFLTRKTVAHALAA